MGEQKVSLVEDKTQRQQFVKRLLKDVEALQYMLDHDIFESGITRIGAEQEMVLVNNKTLKPSPIAPEAIEKMKDKKWLETELAKFNLEICLDPLQFKDDCFRKLQNQIVSRLQHISSGLKEWDTSLILTGILPTFRKFDLDMHNLTPKKRYKALMEAINQQLIGNAYELRLEGIDELLLKHSSPLLEACNTSFQVHLQVDAKDFVQKYNISQALAAPVMAIAANSPLVFGKRLWHESRIAMFQQSIDVRTTNEHLRDRSPRVSFGSSWLDHSIIEIFKEDISRFRVLISSDVTEDSMEVLKNGGIPKLRALQVHNSTVYRWNRPCYGISDNGKPHLRIENRVLPSGPTIVDEVANACLWLGSMEGMSAEISDIREHMSFADARDNFMKAAKFGIDSKFSWFNDAKITAVDLILNELIPYARKGLQIHNIDKSDIDFYLGIIEERAKSHTTGARWLLRSYTNLIEQTEQDEALTAITNAIIKNQGPDSKPIHKWALPSLEDLKEYSPADLVAAEFMNTDLYSVRKDDVIELVADVMDWRNMRYMPVEDAKGILVGLLSSSTLLKYYSKKPQEENPDHICVEDIMIKNPITITGDVKVTEAIKIMNEEKIGCLPVMNGKELIGMITESNFLRLSERLITRMQKS